MRTSIKMSLLASIMIGAFMVNPFNSILFRLATSICTIGILFHYLGNRFETHQYVSHSICLLAISYIQDIKGYLVRPINLKPSEKPSYEKGNKLMTMCSADYPEKATINPLLFKSSRRNNGSKPTILLVESEEKLRFHLQTYLSEDYTVVSFQNGTEALLYIQKKQPDLVISNIHLHGINGNKLSKRLKSNNETVFIPVLLYGLPTISDLRWKRQTSLADTFLLLPFHWEDLKIEIFILLENRFLLRRSLLERIFGEHFLTIQSNSSMTDIDWIFINRVKDLILANMGNENWTISDIASTLCMSRSSFFNKWKSLTGEAPNSFLITLRMEKARQLLESGNYTVADIPLMIGLRDDKHFRRSYKKYFKMVPSASISKKG